MNATDDGAAVGAMLADLRAKRGMPAALAMAEAMLIAAAAIVASERGADHARALLDLAAKVLPR